MDLSEDGQARDGVYLTDRFSKSILQSQESSMESLIAQALIQGGALETCSWGSIGNYLCWTFWIGVTLGIVGTIACFFMKPAEDA